MEYVRRPPLPPLPDKTISADEFWEIAQSPEFADYDIELSEGKIVGLPYTNRQHSETMSLLVANLVPFVYGNKLGRVYCCADGFVLERKGNGEDSAPRIDIAYINAATAPDPDYQDLIEGAPDLAVEVMSPSNTVSEINLKIRQLLDAGARAVWIVDPATCSVQVHSAQGIIMLREEETLSGGDILPGFEIKVADIFPS